MAARKVWRWAAPEYDLQGGSFPGGVGGVAYDFINVGTEGSGGVPADGPKAGGNFPGTLFLDFQEDAVSESVNRGLRALAETADAFDDALRASTPVLDYYTITLVAPAAVLDLASAYTGMASEPAVFTASDLFSVTTTANVSVRVGSSICAVTGVVDQATALVDQMRLAADGFVQSLRLQLNVTLPAGTYRVWCGRRSNLVGRAETRPRSDFLPDALALKLAADVRHHYVNGHAGGAYALTAPLRFNDQHVGVGQWLELGAAAAAAGQLRFSDPGSGAALAQYRIGATSYSALTRSATGLDVGDAAAPTQVVGTTATIAAASLLTLESGSLTAVKCAGFSTLSTGGLHLFAGFDTDLNPFATYSFGLAADMSDHLTAHATLYGWNELAGAHGRLGVGGTEGVLDPRPAAYTTMPFAFTDLIVDDYIDLASGLPGIEQVAGADADALMYAFNGTLMLRQVGVLTFAGAPSSPRKRSYGGYGAALTHVGGTTTYVAVSDSSSNAGHGITYVTSSANGNVASLRETSTLTSAGFAGFRLVGRLVPVTAHASFMAAVAGAWDGTFASTVPAALAGLYFVALYSPAGSDEVRLAWDNTGSGTGDVVIPGWDVSLATTDSAFFSLTLLRTRDRVSVLVTYSRRGSTPQSYTVRLPNFALMDFVMAMGARNGSASTGTFIFNSCETWDV